MVMAQAQEPINSTNAHADSNNMQYHEDWTRSLREEHEIKVADEHFEILELIGSGNFSMVHKAKDKGSGEEIALKIMEPRPQMVLTEVRMLKLLTHPNVLQFRGICVSQATGRYAICLELLSGSDLRTVLVHRVPEWKALGIASQLMSAVEYLHSKQIWHRDLKLDNIMGTKGLEVVKVIDFGLACFAGDSEATSMRCGSPGYVAPEVLGEVVKFGPGSDCFSCGCVLYACFTSRRLFNADSLKGLLRKNYVAEVKLHRLKHLHATSQDMLCGLLRRDPASRMSASQAIALIDSVKQEPTHPRSRHQERSHARDEKPSSHTLAKACLNSTDRTATLNSTLEPNEKRSVSASPVHLERSNGKIQKSLEANSDNSNLQNCKKGRYAEFLTRACFTQSSRSDPPRTYIPSESDVEDQKSWAYVVDGGAQMVVEASAHCASSRSSSKTLGNYARSLNRNVNAFLRRNLLLPGSKSAKSSSIYARVSPQVVES